MGICKLWMDRTLSLVTGAALLAALYLILAERVLPAVRGEPARVAEGERLPGELVFEPLDVPVAGTRSPGTIRLPAERPVLLLVFSSTCPACYANLPAWGRVLDAADGTLVLAVGLERQRLAAAAYARGNLPVARAVVPKQPRRFAGVLGVDIVPFTALVDARGVVRFAHRGRLDAKAVSRLIEALGAQSGSSL